jgi:hypothetical protein
MDLMARITVIKLAAINSAPARTKAIAYGELLEIPSFNA